jgi:hypothetical protein
MLRSSADRLRESWKLMCEPPAGGAGAPTTIIETQHKIGASHMSNHDRTSRRRRIAFGLGATGGGLLAAAFMPMGIALAAPGDAVATTAGDPGVLPIDTETTPDPASDFTGFPDVAANGTTLQEGYFDQQLNIDNSALAAQIDYDIDNKEPFSFGALDGMPAQTSAFTDGVGANGADTGTTDTDPFLDAFQNNGGTANTPLADGMTQQDAISYDYALQHAGLSDAQLTQLDGIADNDIHSVVGTLPVPGPDNDPSVDFVQLFDHNAVNPLNGAPNDIFGTLAVDYDHFLNAFGLGGPLDSFEDMFTGGLTNGTSDALGGIGSTTGDLLGGLTGTGADTLTGVGGTSADAFTNVFADLAGLF